MRYIVEYDQPAIKCTGEEVCTFKEAKRIKKERKKEGYINVRIVEEGDEGDE